MKAAEFITESSYREIDNYPHIKDDIIDIYDYILDYYNVDSDTLDIMDFEFTKQVMPLSALESEIKPLLKNYATHPDDAKRVEAILAKPDTSYPIYVHEGHIIAGTHRSVAYTKLGVEQVIVYIVDIEADELPELY
jgi:hypothetical protein